MAPYREQDIAAIRTRAQIQNAIEVKKQEIARLEATFKNLWSNLELEANSLIHDEERIIAAKAGLVKEIDAVLDQWMAALKELARMV